MDGIVTLLLLGLILALLVLGRRRAKPTDAWLPRQLQGATLAYAERTFRSRRDRIVARLDRAYRLEEHLVLVELKTRKWHRVYPSDVIELSAQRVALHGQTGELVDDTAFVVTQVGTERIAHQVRLLEPDEIRALCQKRDRLRAGTVRGSYAERTAVCKNCGHRAQCDNPHAGLHRLAMIRRSR